MRQGIMRWVVGLLLGVGLILLVVQQLRLVGDFRVDDAYITFSYSKNLALGHGPTYAASQRVEGYSNFLWMWISALGYAVFPSLDPYVFARGVSYGCLALLFGATYCLARPAGKLAAGAAVLWVAASSDLARAAQSGLESVAFTASIACGFALYFEERKLRWSLWVFLLVALLRIDGFVPAVFLIGVEIVRRALGREWSVRELLIGFAPPVVVWCAYFAWRYHYYGLLLPTTYYAKSLVTVGHPGRGLHLFQGMLRDFGALLLVPFVFFSLLPARGFDAEKSKWCALRLPESLTSRSSPLFRAVVLLSFVLYHSAYVVRVGGDWMPFQRFYLPLLAPWAVLFVLGARSLVGLVRERSRGFAVLVGFAALGVWGYSGRHLHARWIDTPEEGGKLAEAHHVENHTKQNLIGVVDLLRHVVREPGDRLVTDYAGVFAVETDAHIIDMWGLCNEDIALHGGTEGINPIYGKECAACYERLAPDYFHVGVPIVKTRDAYSNSRQVLSHVFQGHAIDRVIGIRRHFAVGRVVEETTGRALWFFERRRPDRGLETRSPAPHITVEYPFEAAPPGGAPRR